MAKEVVCGIYKITNKINGKCYIGKSVNIYSRFSNHKSQLKREYKSRDTNRYLFNAVKKYGLDNFSFDIIELLEPIDSLLKERELYWMDHYNSCDKSCGYNLRRDSSSQSFVHEDTRRLLSKINKGENNPNYGNKWSDEKKEYMSKLKKEGLKNGTISIDIQNTYKAIEVRNKRWKDNPQLKKDMRLKISKIHNLYEYLKIDKHTGEILEVFQNRLELLDKYPDHKTSPLLSVCNGWKKSYKGFIWRYRDRETNLIIEPKKKWLVTKDISS